MIILRRIPPRPVRWRAPVAAIGIFDGVHRGHQAILLRAVHRAVRLGGTPAAVTFHPHPLTILAPRLVPSMLLSLDERLRLFASCGIRATLVIPFTQSFSRWSPETFVRKLLVERLHVREVVIGHDFGFGRGRSGSVETLKEFGRRLGFQVHVVPPFRLGGERIASHRIREVIRQGDLAQAARLLGHPSMAMGRVVRGRGRGVGLGFPTANLKVEAGVLPPVGVYAVWARVEGRRKIRPGMANLGYRPTFDRRSGHPLLEVHLFGEDRPLYGRRLEVAFVRRLRPEKKFSSPAALGRQLALDARRARQALKGKPLPQNGLTDSEPLIQRG